MCPHDVLRLAGWDVVHRQGDLAGGRRVRGVSSDAGGSGLRSGLESGSGLGLESELGSRFRVRDRVRVRFRCLSSDVSSVKSF